LLMLHFLRRLAAIETTAVSATAAAPLLASWLAIALAAVAVPWAVYAVLWGSPWSAAFDPAALWAAIWPMLVGGGLAAALWRWGAALPKVPPGDIVVAAERGWQGIACRAGALDRLDALLRAWPVAATCLLAVAVVLAVALSRSGMA
jgi:hypothetical protein